MVISRRGTTPSSPPRPGSPFSTSSSPVRLAGYCAFVWLVKHASPARAATFAYVNPVVAVFLGWLILDETLGARTLAASAIIILSVILVSTARPAAPKTS